MPYRNFKKKAGKKTKYCMTAIATGKTYCSDSPKKRAKMAKMHEMFKHMGK